MNSIPKVPVGPTTVIGTSVSTLAFSAAIAAYLTGDRSEQTIGAIVGGAVGALILVVTLLGRFAQAKMLIPSPTPTVAARQQELTQMQPPANASAATWNVPGGPRIIDTAQTPPPELRLADPLLDDPEAEPDEGDEPEPEISDDELAGRNVHVETVGHGDSDMRDDHDRAAVA